MWMAATELQERQFADRMNKLKSLNAEAYNWLVGIPVQHWALCYDGGCRTTTNSSEAFNRKEVRSIPITALVRATFHRIVVLFERGRARATAELSNNHVFTEIVREEFEVRRCIESQGAWLWQPTGTIWGGIVRTHGQRRSPGGPFKGDVMHLWSISIWPLSLQSCQKGRMARTSVDSWVARFYRCDEMLQTSSGSFFPLGHKACWPPAPFTLYPNINRQNKRPGRPRSRRFVGEIDRSNPRRCGSCKQAGKNAYYKDCGEIVVFLILCISHVIPYFVLFRRFMFCISHVIINLRRMATDGMQPGPEIPSLLTLQHCHRSTPLWTDPTSTPLSGEFGVWSLPPICRRVFAYIERAELHLLYSCGRISLDHSLITALVERWRQETHTFHLRCGEATITLQDVSVLWGLRADGRPVIAPEHHRSSAQWVDYCLNFLGLRPSYAGRRHTFFSYQVKSNWKLHYSISSDGLLTGRWHPASSSLYYFSTTSWCHDRYSSEQVKAAVSATTGGFRWHCCI